MLQMQLKLWGGNISSYTIEDKENYVGTYTILGTFNVEDHPEYRKTIEEFSDIKYISNYKYFMINPQHGPNDVPPGVCTTVALQMLLGYHNYYSDRRIIPTFDMNGNRLLNSEYADMSYDPVFDRQFVGWHYDQNNEFINGCTRLGTTQAFRDVLLSKTSSQTIGAVGRSIDDYLDSYVPFLKSETTHSYDKFNANIVRTDIDCGNPVILGFDGGMDSNFSWHVVVAYGYAKLDGEDGFLVHFGHGSTRIMTWVPEDWFGYQIRMSVNHAHTFNDEGANIKNTHRELKCDDCNGNTVDTLYSVSGSSIKSVKYPLGDSVTIPAQLYGKDISYIDQNAFAGQTGIKNLIARNITSIRHNAFDGCTSLESATFSASLSSIGDFAFKDCKKLESFVIGENANYIGDGVFLGCTALNLSCNMKNQNYTLSSGILYTKDKTKIVASGANVLSNLIIPETVNEIVPFAFCGNTKITTLKFQEENPLIGESAFADCTNIAEIYFYDINVPAVGASAFANVHATMYVPNGKFAEYSLAIRNTNIVGGNDEDLITFERQYILTLNSSGRILISHKIFVIYGKELPTENIFAPEKTGYAFDGYYSNDGTMYYTMALQNDQQTADINHCAEAIVEKVVPVKNKLWDRQEDVTLEGRWVPLECAYEYLCLFGSSQIGTGSAQLTTVEGSGMIVAPPSINKYTFAYFEYNTIQYNLNQQIPIKLERRFDGMVYPNATLLAYYNEEAENCVVEGTLITLADGSRVPVEQLTGNEMLLVWNLFTGQFDCAPILFIDEDPLDKYQVINLSFSDGTIVKIVSEHAFWDITLNKYVYLNEDAQKYVGHYFAKQTTDESEVMINAGVQLVDVYITTESTTVYSPVTSGHFSYYVNGMLSIPGGIEGMFNIFETDTEKMQYDIDAYNADIARYGTFTYEEFCQVVPISQSVFEAINAKYLKVAIGKGMITIDRLNALYLRYFDKLK